MSKETIKKQREYDAMLKDSRPFKLKDCWMLNYIRWYESLGKAKPKE